MSQWDDQGRETQRLPQQGPPAGQYAPDAGYGRPGFGPQGQPGYPLDEQGRPRYRDTTANPFGAASDQAFGIVSAVLALLGGVVGIVALTGLTWFKGGIDFSQTSDGLDAAATPPTASPRPISGGWRGCS